MDTYLGQTFWHKYNSLLRFFFLAFACCGVGLNLFSRHSYAGIEDAINILKQKDEVSLIETLEKCCYVQGDFFWVESLVVLWGDFYFASAYLGKSKILDYLLSNIQSLLCTRDEYAHTALHIASERGHHDAVVVLLKHAERARILGTLLLTSTRDGMSALHLAVDQQHESIVNVLLSVAASLSNTVLAIMLKLSSNNNATALDIACDVRHPVMAAVLCRMMCKHNIVPSKYSVAKMEDCVSSFLKREESR